MFQTELSGKFVIIYSNRFSHFGYFSSPPPLGLVCRLYFACLFTPNRASEEEKKVKKKKRKKVNQPDKHTNRG